MDFSIIMYPFIAPLNLMFEALSIVVKVLMLIPPPMAILISLCLAFFVIRLLVGLL